MRLILLVLGLLFAAPAAAQVSVAVTTEVDRTRTMTHEIAISAAPDAVWQAVATIDGWKSWAVPSAWAKTDDLDSFETSYSLDGAPGAASNITNRFMARLPGRIAVFHTTQTPDGFPHAAEYKRVISFFEIMPHKDGSLVRLTGTGYAAGKAGDDLIGFFREGNRQSLESLRDRFVKGPVDWRAKLTKRAP